MFTKNWKSKLQKVVAGLSVSGLMLAGLCAALPANAAYAAPATPPAQDPTVTHERLEQAYQREQQQLKIQQDNLDMLNIIADQVQQFITTQQGQGKDVTALQAALATFKSQITTAQASHATAANILSAHAGFDINGKVTDATQARQTIRAARQSLGDAHIVMRQATLDLHRALREWRQANRPTGTQATPTPSNNG